MTATKEIERQQRYLAELRHTLEWMRERNRDAQSIARVQAAIQEAEATLESAVNLNKENGK